MNTKSESNSAATKIFESIKHDRENTFGEKTLMQISEDIANFESTARAMSIDEFAQWLNED